MQQGYRNTGSRERPQRDERPRSEALALTGASDDVKTVGQMLARASENGHLVAPATAIAMLPAGCSVVLSAVHVDPSETYSVGSKLGLAKSALDRIASAAGVSWIPEQSGRLDDGSDPYYCAWRAVGTLRHLDGTEITIEGSKEMDLRQGSPHNEGLYERYEAGRRNPPRGNKAPPKDPTAQIREMRMHIMAHAESKAKLRAIRSIGVRSAYDAVELEKPFVVARLMFTGHSDDPEIRARFAELTAQAFLGGRRALFGGGSPAPAPAMITARAVQPSSAPRLAPPPVGHARFDDDDRDDDEYTRGAPQRDRQREPIRSEPTPNRSQPAREQADANDAPDRGASGFEIPGGRNKGQPIEDASDNDLEFWRDRISQRFDAGEVDPRFADKDKALLDAIKAELDARDAIPTTGDDR